MLLFVCCSSFQRLRFKFRCWHYAQELYLRSWSELRVSCVCKSDIFVISVDVTAVVLKHLVSFYDLITLYDFWSMFFSPDEYVLLLLPLTCYCSLFLVSLEFRRDALNKRGEVCKRGISDGHWQSILSLKDICVWCILSLLMTLSFILLDIECYWLITDWISIAIDYPSVSLSIQTDSGSLKKWYSIGPPLIHTTSYSIWQSDSNESIIIYHRWRILSICKDSLNTINIVYRLHGNNHSLGHSLNPMCLDIHSSHLIHVSRWASP